MTKLVLNSIMLKEYPQDFKVVDIDTQFNQLNQILGSLYNVHYYLHSGKLYFIGNEEDIRMRLEKYNFTVSNIAPVTLTPIDNWEIVQPIFYKALHFYFMRHNSIWQPRKMNKFLKQAFILEPEWFEGTQLVHEVYNNHGERLVVYEGFKYWLEFLGDTIILTLLPKVKPIIPLKPTLEKQDIIFFSKQPAYLEVSPNLIRSKGFYFDFRKIALKGNTEKRNVLKNIIKLLSNGKEEIIIPIGNLNEGLVFSTEFIKIESRERGFYDK
ncbi:MAG: hypothetical protein ACP5KW_08510 [Thermoproteota archaeon]